MERLNRTSAPQAKTYTEKVIQFGEGNFLRAFVDWIIWKTNQKTDFNASVVLVQPIEKGMVDNLNEQDGLYHLNLQGIDEGKPVDSLEMIDVISRGLNPYREFDSYLALAEQPQMRFIISNTTEAGIAFDPNCKFTDKPASSYPGKLTQLLYHRFEYFKGDKSKGFIIMPCELIFENGKHLKECIRQYIKLWNLGEEFSEWFETACGVYSTLVDRIVPGYPRDNAALKVFYNRYATLEHILHREGCETYIAMKRVKTVRGGVEKWTERPLVSSLLFVRCEEKLLYTLKYDFETRFLYYRDLKTGRPAPIPQKQMDIFRIVTRTRDSGLEYLGESFPGLKTGDRVRVISGPFEGAEGYIKRVKSDRRLLVEIEGVAVVATPFIHPSLLEKIED